MSHELHYTSAPRGLKPGSKGFCTVARTLGMPVVLSDRLENLSGYRQVYPPHDPNAGRNPACRSHLLLGQGGQAQSILSRIGFAGLDYTDRSNKYAHHVVLATHERPDGGPAWLAAQPGFLETAWEGEPRTLGVGRTPPQGDRPAAVCRRWQAQTGDAGWAGVLAETARNDPRKVVYLIVPIDLDPLPLLEEALALVPPEHRWDVTFSTYFTNLPPGMTCQWRCVLAGSPEATQARRLPDAMVIDLTSPLGPAPASAIVDQARTGKAPVAEPAKPKPTASTNRPKVGPDPVEPIGSLGLDDIADLPPPMPPSGPARTFGRQTVNPGRPRSSSLSYRFAAILAGSAGLLVVGIWLIQHFVRDIGPKQAAIEVARNDPQPPRNVVPPPPPPQPQPQPPDDRPNPVDEPKPKGNHGGQLATITPPGPDASPTTDVPQPPIKPRAHQPATDDTTAGTNPKPEPTGDRPIDRGKSDPEPGVKVADGPKRLKYWGLPRRAGSLAGGSGQESPSKPYTAIGRVRSIQLMGLKDQDQRLEAGPGDTPQSLKIVRSDGPGSRLRTENNESVVGTFRWDGPTIAFTMEPTVRDPVLLTAFLDCILKVESEDGSVEYVFLTDPDALASERSTGEATRALSLPDSIHWGKNKEKPDDIPIDRWKVFGTAQVHQASLSQSNRPLVLVSCRFHAYPGSRWPLPKSPELVPDRGKVGAKLVRPSQGLESRITATIEGRSGHLVFEFSPSPPTIEAEHRELDEQLKELEQQAKPLNEKHRKGTNLTLQERKKGEELDRQAHEIESKMADLTRRNAWNNGIIYSGLELTVGILCDGELFLLPTIRSPKLASASATDGR